MKHFGWLCLLAMFCCNCNNVAAQDTDESLVYSAKSEVSLEIGEYVTDKGGKEFKWNGFKAMLVSFVGSTYHTKDVQNNPIIIINDKNPDYEYILYGKPKFSTQYWPDTVESLRDFPEQLRRASVSLSDCRWVKIPFVEGVWGNGASRVSLKIDINRARQSMAVKDPYQLLETASDICEAHQPMLLALYDKKTKNIVFSAIIGNDMLEK